MMDRTSAVVLACDAAYLPFALHLAWQITRASPARRFDILIVSEDVLDLPAWAAAAGIRGHLMPRQDWIDRLPTVGSVRTLPRASYLRLALADELGGRYRRILYLDSDIYFEGGDLDRLLDLPLGDHPVAAARDFLMLRVPKFHAPEFKAIGLSARPYFNSGVLLIETDAYRREKVLQQCIAFFAEHPQACLQHDQSLLNGVLQGRFAELAPSWNWQVTAALPFACFDYPVYFRHFITRNKPWSDKNGVFAERYARSYREFFRDVLPSASALVTDSPPYRLIRLQKLVNCAVRLARRRAPLEAELARFTDAWSVKI